MAASSSYFSSSINVGVSTDELTCTICFEILTEPVTLPCGHSFCNLCVEKCWKSWEEVGECFCPNCREVFPQKPKLKKNVMLAGLVAQVQVQVKMKQEEVESRIDVNDSGSHCEMCNRQAAKLCLPCEILCCEKHVKPHEQKGHKLVEPGKDVGELRCPDHKRSIQLHCIDDGKLMCPMCMDGQHQNHKVVAVEIAHTELKGILTAKCPEVSKSKQHVQSQLHQLENEVKDTQHVGQGTEDRLEAKRRMLYQYVDEAVDLLKSRVHKVQEKKLFLLEKQIEKLQQQMGYLCKAESSLQTSLQELEVISFLGGFKDLVKRIEVGLHFQSMKVKPSKLLDFSQEEKDLDSLTNNNKKFVDRITKEPVRHPEMDEFELSSCRSLYFRTPSLDRNSGHPRIVISEDLKTATLSQTTNLCPEYPDRFDSHPQVLSSESFSSDHHFWEVNVGSCRQCRIGVALNSMGRKGKESRLGENPESWCVEKNKNGYLAWHNNKRTSLQGNPNRLGFFLNCEEGELRCFGDLRVLHVFKGNFKEAVKPALGIDDFKAVNYGYGYVSAVVDSVWFCLF